MGGVIYPVPPKISHPHCARLERFAVPGCRPLVRQDILDVGHEVVGVNQAVTSHTVVVNVDRRTPCCVRTAPRAPPAPRCPAACFFYRSRTASAPLVLLHLPTCPHHPPRPPPP